MPEALALRLPAWIRLLRIPVLFISILAPLAVASFCEQLEFTLPMVLMTLTAISGISSFMMLNEIVDRPWDKFSKPWKPLVTSEIKVGYAWLYFVVMQVICWASIIWYLSLKWNPLYLVFAVLGYLAGFVYNVFSKRFLGAFGHIFFSLSIGSAFMMFLVAFGRLEMYLSAVIALMLLWYANDAVISYQDSIGDKKAGIFTTGVHLDKKTFNVSFPLTLIAFVTFYFSALPSLTKLALMLCCLFSSIGSAYTKFPADWKLVQHLIERYGRTYYRILLVLIFTFMFMRV